MDTAALALVFFCRADALLCLKVHPPASKPPEARAASAEAQRGGAVVCAQSVRGSINNSVTLAEPKEVACRWTQGGPCPRHSR